MIGSLKFKSSKQTFGPYGTEEGTTFVLPTCDWHVLSQTFVLPTCDWHVLSQIHTANIYDSIYQKIPKLGTAAYKKLGNKNGHGHAAKAENNKAIAEVISLLMLCDVGMVIHVIF